MNKNLLHPSLVPQDFHYLVFPQFDDFSNFWRLESLIKKAKNNLVFFFKFASLNSYFNPF